MTSTKFNNLWMLMFKYAFEIDSEQKQEDLSCAICKKIMIDSYQSECGCQYCYKCIRGYLNTGNKYCPGMKDECKEESLLLDRNVCRNTMLNRKISKLIVHCPNEACEVKVELLKMESHIRICMKEIIDCPYAVLGCDNKYEHKDKMFIHLNEQLLKHNHLIIEYIQNIKNEFSNLKENSIDIELNQMEILSLRSELEIAKLEIISLKEESIVKKNEMTHDIECLKEESMIQLFEMKSQMEFIKEELSNMKIKMSTEMENVRSDITKVPKKDEGMVKSRVIERKTSPWTSIRELEGGGSRALELILTENYDVIWIFKEISLKSKLLKKSYLSDPFYKKHYKLCLGITFIGTVNGVFVYFYVYILRGDTDHEAQWPMKHPMRVSIINQWTQRASVTLDCSYDTILYGNKSEFNKPVMDKNDGILCGTINFLVMMGTPEVIYEDSALIGFSVL